MVYPTSLVPSSNCGDMRLPFRQTTINKRTSINKKRLPIPTTILLSAYT